MHRILSILFCAFCTLMASAGITPESDDARFNGDRCYSFGDYETALKYYQRAVSLDAKNVRAISRIGMMYKRGLGVKRDYKKALDWYAKGAATGDASSIFNVGTFYLAGQGVKRDYEEAMMWFRLASEKGCADADYQMGCLYFSGTGVKQDYREAIDWFQKAADRRYLGALVNIGYMCCNGMGVVKDPVIGVQWYLYAAKYGSAEAMRNLGYCYNLGEGVDADPEESLRWYQEAASHGDQPSIAYLRSIGKYEAPGADYQEVPLVIDENDTDDEAAEEDEFGTFHDEDNAEGEPEHFENLPELPE